MLPFWTGGTPPLPERTHVWDVSGTRWEEYGRGKKLTSPTFSCAGVDGLYMTFYPVGDLSKKDQEGKPAVFLDIAPEHDTVMVAFRITIDGKRHTAANLANLGRGCGWGNFMPSQEAYRTITVELLDVRRKKSASAVVRVECAARDRLRVTACEQTARASFGVEGLRENYRGTHKGLLGQTGEVLEVTPTAVKLKHDDGSVLWWGHEALSRLPLTSAQVDAMKVRCKQPAWRALISGDMRHV